MIRELIFKISRSLTARAVSSRQDFHIPIKIWLEPDCRTKKLPMPTEPLTITGETSDMSKTGIGFIVASVRIKEKYLVGEGNLLNAELDLSGAKVQMQLIGRRYIQVGQHVSTDRFLIGAEIIEMNAADREIYEAFIGPTGKKIKGNLALGIDEG